MLFAVALPDASRADPVKGDASFSAGGGFARLVLKLDDDVDSEVTVAGTILVIRFKRAVDIPVDKLSDAVPDYVGSARRDPDGLAIRLALARKAMQRMGGRIWAESRAGAGATFHLELPVFDPAAGPARVGQGPGSVMR